MAIEYGRPERGVFLLKRQLIIDPSNVKARILLLEALLKLERYNAAKQHVQESLAQPTGIQFELQLANVVARLEAEKAEEALQRDIADEPTTDEQSIDTTRVPDRKSYEIVDIGLLPDEIEPRSSETAALQDPFEDVEAGAIGFPAPPVAEKLIALSETKPIKPAPTQDPRPTPIKQPTPKYGEPELVSRYRATVSGALSKLTTGEFVDSTNYRGGQLSHDAVSHAVTDPYLEDQSGEYSRVSGEISYERTNSQNNRLFMALQADTDESHHGDLITRTDGNVTVGYEFNEQTSSRHISVSQRELSTETGLDVSESTIRAANVSRSDEKTRWTTQVSFSDKNYDGQADADRYDSQLTLASLGYQRTFHDKGRGAILMYGGEQQPKTTNVTNRQYSEKQVSGASLDLEAELTNKHRVGYGWSLAFEKFQNALPSNALAREDETARAYFFYQIPLTDQQNSANARLSYANAETDSNILEYSKKTEEWIVSIDWAL